MCIFNSYLGCEKQKKKCLENHDINSKAETVETCYWRKQKPLQVPKHIINHEREHIYKKSRNKERE